MGTILGLSELRSSSTACKRFYEEFVSGLSLRDMRSDGVDFTTCGDENWEYLRPKCFKSWKWSVYRFVECVGGVDLLLHVYQTKQRSGDPFVSTPPGKVYIFLMFLMLRAARADRSGSTVDNGFVETRLSNILVGAGKVECGGVGLTEQDNKGISFILQDLCLC